MLCRAAIRLQFDRPPLWSVYGLSPRAPANVREHRPVKPSAFGLFAPVRAPSQTKSIAENYSGWLLDPDSGSVVPRGASSSFHTGCEPRNRSEEHTEERR